MKKTLKWIAIIFIALIVLVAIFGGGDEDAKEVKSDATAVAEPAEEAIVVTANELFEAYQSNEVAADNCKGDGEVAGFVQLGKCTFK